MSTALGVWGGGGGCGTNWPTEGVGIATLNELDENDRFFTTSCGPYRGHTLGLFFTFHIKKDTKRTAFVKNVLNKYKTRQKLQVGSFFLIYITL